MSERLLVVGADGRSQALTWKLLQDPNVESVAVAPGNAGTNYLGDRSYNVPVDISDIDGQIALAKRLGITLVVFSPEGPLIAGGVDAMTAADIDAFGPRAKEAQIEGSKIFSAQFNAAHDIPQPDYFASHSFNEVAAFIERCTWDGIVVKADGEAAGKGVIVCRNKTEAIEAARLIMVDKIFGDAGNGVLLQERLRGREVSVIIMTDGQQYIELPTMEDHKQVGDGDTGPNTGGMGVVGPVDYITAHNRQIIDDVIIPRALNGLREVTDGRGYRGALYFGLMIDDAGPKVIEYNARFGNPEAQGQLTRMRSSLPHHMRSCIEGNLNSADAEFYPDAVASVTLAAHNYPGEPRRGDVIYGQNEITDPLITVYHAGTRREGKNIITNGGRVLNVTARGATIPDALDHAYGAIGPQGIHFDGMIYRRDIGRRK